MITPAYSPTATERVLPRLALDFTTGVLDPRVTVTRALNTATRVNSSGLIESVNANLPRFDYDPSTLAPKGLLIEEQRANLFTYSQDFSNVAWDPDGLTKTSGLAGGLDGTASVGEFSKTFSGIHYPRNSAVNMATNTTYTISMWVWHTGAPPADVKFAYYAGSWNTSPSLAITTTPTRFTWTVTTGATAPSFGTGLYLNFGASGGAVRVWGAQLESGAFATSYIPTTTTSLTRNADVVSMTGTNFSSWYNASEGAFAAWFSSFSSAPGILGDQTAASAVLYSSSLDAKTFNGASGLTANGTFTLNAPAKCVLAYSGAGRSIALNGNTVAQDANALQSVTTLEIGRSFISVYLNGHFSKLFYYPQRITNAEVQAFSKG